MSLTPTNWQEVQKTLAIKLKTIACEGEYNRLILATDFNTFFEVLFTNYEWLKEKNYMIAEFEAITPIQYSEFIVWLLETYCLGKGVDSVVQSVIDLHKSKLAGNEPTAKQWTAAMAAAWDAAMAAGWVAARAAGWVAARAAARVATRAAARVAWAAASAAASDAARVAASDAAMAAGWVAARDASAAAWNAARENISKKLISIIYK